MGVAYIGDGSDKLGEVQRLWEHFIEKNTQNDYYSLAIKSLSIFKKRVTSQTEHEQMISFDDLSIELTSLVNESIPLILYGDENPDSWPSQIEQLWDASSSNEFRLKIALGIAYKQIGKYQKAIEECQDAEKEKNPEIIDAIYQIGCISLIKEDWHLAISRLESVLTRVENYRNARDYLMQAHRKLDRQSKDNQQKIILADIEDFLQNGGTTKELPQYLSQQSAQRAASNIAQRIT